MTSATVPVLLALSSCEKGGTSTPPAQVPSTIYQSSYDFALTDIGRTIQITAASGDTECSPSRSFEPSSQDTD